MIGLLAPLLLIAVIVAVVMLVRQRDGGTRDREGSLRRVFLYGLSFVGLMVAASGLAGLVRVAFEGFGGTALVDDDRGLALGLTMLVIGTPVWAVTWRSAQARIGEHPGELRATGRRLYLAAVRVVALSVAVPSLVAVIWWTFGAVDDPARPAAWTLVWGAVWAYHEHRAGEVRFGGTDPEWPDRIFVYLASLVFLGTAAAAAGILAATGLEQLYDLGVDTSVLVGGPRPWEVFLQSAVVLVVSGALWWWYWLRVADADAGSRPWRVYVFLAGIVGGTLTVLSSAGVVLNTVFEWLLDATTEPLREHFRVVPGGLAGAAVGVVVWGHHRARLTERDREARAAAWTSSERIYYYVLAGLLVVTAAAGVSVLLAAGVDAVIPGRTLVEVGGGLREALALGLTSIVIGAPTWGWAWSAITRRVEADPAERTTMPRRVLIFAVFGVAIVTALSAGGALLFQLLIAALESDLGWSTLEQERWAIGLLLSAAAVSAYHWSVLKADRRLAPESEPPRIRLKEVVVVSPSAGATSALERRLDVRVTSWTRADVAGDGAVVDVESVAAAVEGIGAPRALVVVSGTGELEVIPLED